MLKIAATTLFVIVMIPIPGTADSTDVLGAILNEVGFTRDDLGYESKGYWNRYPLDTDYRLTSFDDLFAEPLKICDYATVMANTVEFYLDPVYADSTTGGLYKLVYNLGVDKKRGGFRSYSANLIPAPEGNAPLVQAIREVFSLADSLKEFYRFESTVQVQEAVDKIDEVMPRLSAEVETVLAELIVNLTDAIRWRTVAFRNCDRDDMKKAMAIRDLADSQSDGQKYYSELDDIAHSIDWSSLHYAALKVAAAAENAEVALRPLVDKMANEFELEIKTPFGKIAVFSPVAERGKEYHGVMSTIQVEGKPCFEFDATKTLLVLDFGRDIVYQGTPGATATLENPVSVMIDLGGDDQYGYGREEYLPTSGVGLLGIGLVIDSKGDDYYRGSTYAQGAGLFGVGILLDRSGDDKYEAGLSAQGCGYFGIGLCFDVIGDDEYYLYAEGQGMGGVGGGIGVLASFSGNDKYTAEISPEVYDRADYHSQMKINANNVQGFGGGRRGDMTDGHAWAGGLGAIIDIYGDDHYYSGNWSLGASYWFATGIAVDRHGDDIYESCYFTQGSGAHFCNAILLDEGGNDEHELFETAGAAFGFGWDFCNAFLINKGGNDCYRANMISMGLAQIRSFAFLIDIGGDDMYQLGKGTPGLGEASPRDDFAHPSLLTPYVFYAKSFGGFIDIGGSDIYHVFDDDGESEHPVARENNLWLQPARSDSTFGANNYGVGIDTEEGTVPELYLWE